jgi:hypothetical protein
MGCDYAPSCLMPMPGTGDLVGMSSLCRRVSAPRRLFASGQASGQVAFQRLYPVNKPSFVSDFSNQSSTLSQTRVLHARELAPARKYVPTTAGTSMSLIVRNDTPLSLPVQTVRHEITGRHSVSACPVQEVL